MSQSKRSLVLRVAIKYCDRKYGRSGSRTKRKLCVRQAAFRLSKRTIRRLKMDLEKLRR